MTGVLMAVFQLLLFPPLIKVVGIATCQRLAFLASVPALLVVPAVKMLSWNYPSLFTVSVTANTLANCCVGVVSEAVEFVNDTSFVVHAISPLLLLCLVVLEVGLHSPPSLGAPAAMASPALRF